VTASPPTRPRSQSGSARGRRGSAPPPVVTGNNASVDGSIGAASTLTGNTPTAGTDDGYGVAAANAGSLPTGAGAPTFWMQTVDGSGNVVMLSVTMAAPTPVPWITTAAANPATPQPTTARSGTSSGSSFWVTSPTMTLGSDGAAGRVTAVPGGGFVLGSGPPATTIGPPAALPSTFAEIKAIVELEKRIRTMELPDYTPSPKTSIATWIDRVDLRLRGAVGLQDEASDRMLFSILGNKLREETADEFVSASRQLLLADQTWTRLKERLMARFGERLDSAAAIWRVHMRAMMPGETFADYAAALRKLVGRNVVGEDVLLGQFYRNLEKSMRQLVQLQPQPKTIEEAATKGNTDRRSDGERGAEHTDDRAGVGDCAEPVYDLDDGNDRSDDGDSRRELGGGRLRGQQRNGGGGRWGCVPALHQPTWRVEQVLGDVGCTCESLVEWALLGPEESQWRM